MVFIRRICATEPGLVCSASIDMISCPVISVSVFVFQWRKELQEELEEEERGKAGYLEEQQALVEAQQREVAQNKASKFKNQTPSMV